MFPTFQESIIGLRIVVTSGQPRSLCRVGEVDFQGHNDLSGDLVLKFKHIGHVSVIAIGPQMSARYRVDQLRVDPHLITRAADTAF